MVQMWRNKRNELKKQGKKGFTLMELLVVVAILGFLAVMLLPKYSQYTDKAMAVAAAADAKSILTVATAELVDNGKIPTNTEIATAVGLDTASGKKIDPGTPATYKYEYEKNGAKVIGDIDVPTGTIDWTVESTDTDKKDRIEKALGVTP